MRADVADIDVKDTISRQDAINLLKKWSDGYSYIETETELAIKQFQHLPSAQPTLRERALMLLLNWAEECGFGYDNFPEEYERYKDEIEDMSYFDGMVYIAEKEVERNG